MFLCGLQKHMLGISLQWVLGTCVLRMRSLKSIEINCPSCVIRRKREGSKVWFISYRSESKTKLRVEKNCVTILHIISFHENKNPSMQIRVVDITGDWKPELHGMALSRIRRNRFFSINVGNIWLISDCYFAPMVLPIIRIPGKSDSFFCKGYNHMNYRFHLDSSHLSQ